MEQAEGIVLDINRDRIKSVLSETYTICAEQLNVEFDKTQEEFVRQIDPYLDSNRVSIPVFLELPSARYPGLRIEVNLRRQKVFARIPSRKRHHPKQVLLNKYLKVL